MYSVAKFGHERWGEANRNSVCLVMPNQCLFLPSGRIESCLETSAQKLPLLSGLDPVISQWWHCRVVGNERPPLICVPGVIVNHVCAFSI